MYVFTGKPSDRLCGSFLEWLLWGYPHSVGEPEELWWNLSLV